MLIGSLKPGLYPSLDGALRPQADFLSPDPQGRTPFPLDGQASFVAFSTRRLYTAYTGPCMRVRRSSDSVEADIGFTPAGRLDTVALLAHVGANSGFVRTWYDQSGAGRNANQVTTTLQPRIVNAGTVDFLSGTEPGIAHVAANATLAYGGTITVTGNGITVAHLQINAGITREIGPIVGSSPNTYIDFDGTGAGTTDVQWRPDGVAGVNRTSPGGARSAPRCLIGRASTVAGLARVDYKTASGTLSATDAGLTANASLVDGQTGFNVLAFQGTLHTWVVVNAQLADSLFDALRDKIASFGGF